MCGITGISIHRETSNYALIKDMSDALRHRGPDDEGFLSINTRSGEITTLTGPESMIDGPRIEGFTRPADLMLGHRRLSIIDTSPLGHQPMGNRDGSLWVVFNGEIYNYIELKVELRALGHEFTTNTDTEVLLAAYERWGEGCLERFNGMWAFVIYDARKNELFGARDRFGVKPLYYSIGDEYLAFASEIKALMKLDLVPRSINQDAVFDYLVFAREEDGEEGFFNGVYELFPSFAFRYDLSAKRFTKWRYYQLEYAREWESFDSAKAAEYTRETRELLFDAVRLRLRSDVPVGSCLSGGIDSSAIVCAIDRILEGAPLAQLGDRQRVLTAAYDEASVDESRWARAVVDSTGSRWLKTFPRADELAEDLERLVYIQDIPFGSTSIYAQFKVMELARDNGLKVLLDGQGGDELFSGYKSYYGIYYAEIFSALAVRALIGEIRGLHNSPVVMKEIVSFLAKLFGAAALPNSLKAVALRFMEPEYGCLNRDFWGANIDRLSLVAERAVTSLNSSLAQNMSSFKLKGLLRYEDRNSMNFSIESRTPFADDINLIEHIFSIPSSYKIHNGWSKYLLREASRGLIPDEIRVRTDKLGFATPEYNWLNENKDSFVDYITPDLDDFLDTKKIRRQWSSLVSGRSGKNMAILWRFINLGAWKRAYGL